MAADGKAVADADEVPAKAAPAKSKSGVVLILIAVLLSAGASGGAAWFFAGRGAAAPAATAEGAAEEHKPKEPAQYLALDPAFVVNLEDRGVTRYLQVEVQVMGRGKDAHELEVVKAHAPRIRNALLMLFGQQNVADLGSRAGKERLQAQVLTEIQTVLKEETGKPVVEAVYFTSFVMQ